MNDFTNEERNNFDREYEKMRLPRPTILVCGWTGAGKSSLIKAMLDVDVPIKDGSPCTQHFDVYENDLARVFDSKGMEKGEMVSDFVQKIGNFIKERRTTSDIENNVHLVWYVVDAVACRFDDGDVEIIKELCKFVEKRSIVFVLTKCDSARKTQMESLIQRIKEKCDVTDRDIIPVCDEEGMKDERTPNEIKHGLSDLLNHSFFILPDAVHDAWTMAQKVDIEKKLELIKKKKPGAITIVSGATVAAGGAAAIPIPIGNTVAITGIQIGMVGSLAGIYTAGIPKESILPFVAAVAGRQAAASLLTLLPGIGSIINAGIATAFTGGIGTYCIAVFEKAAIAKAKGEKMPELKFDLNLVMECIKNHKKIE